jgi:hypothetical protein
VNRNEAGDLGLPPRSCDVDINSAAINVVASAVPHILSAVPAQQSVSLKLTKLTSGHAVNAFTCGTKPGATEIDDYIRTSALQEQEAGLSVVWLVIDTDADRAEDAIVGFFSLSPVTVKVNPAVTAAVGLQSISYPAIGGWLLGRLGVAVKHQGGTMGRDLVAAARDKALELRESGGGAFLVVDPKNDELSAWYASLHFGFQRLDPTNAKVRRIFLKL